MRFLTTLVFTVASCQFSGAPTPGSGGSPDAASADASSADAAIAADAQALVCGSADPRTDSLAVCLEFEDNLTEEIEIVAPVMSAGMLSFGEGMAPSSRGLLLDGESHLFVPGHEVFESKTLTVAIWVKPNAIPSQDRVGIVDFESNFGVFLFPDGEVRCSGEYGLVSGGALSVGTWSHVLCRQSADGGQELFIDGERVDCVIEPRTPIDPPPQPVMFGANSPDGSSEISATLDAFRFFTRAISDTEVCRVSGRSDCPPTTSCDD